MNNPTLEDEITKRLKRRIKMKRIRLVAIVIFNIIGFIMSYVYYVLVFGINTVYLRIRADN